MGVFQKVGLKLFFMDWIR